MLEVEELILTIEKELDDSSSAWYKCVDGFAIPTDVAHVAEWFDQYKKVLRYRDKKRRKEERLERKEKKKKMKNIS